MYISPDIPDYDSCDYPGDISDLKVLDEDQWLVNTEVRYILRKKDGLWHLTMIFIALANPLKFLCRNIDTYNSEKTAQTFARILQRGIRKDARGTLKSNRNALNICHN